MHAPVLVHTACMALLVGSVLLGGTAHSTEPTRPPRIGALSESWGPTPQIVGLRDGLLELNAVDLRHRFMGAYSIEAFIY